VEGKVCFKKLKEHCFEFPQEVMNVFTKILPLVDYIVYDSPSSVRFRHPGSVRSLILYLYARSKERPVYKVAEEFKVAPEQLYRIERALKRDGIYEKVIETAKKLLKVAEKKKS